MEDEQRQCRICLDDGPLSERDEWLSPCDCKGSAKYVHRSCLAKWRSTGQSYTRRTRCMTCNKAYPDHVKSQGERQSERLCKYTIYTVLIVTVGLFWYRAYVNGSAKCMIQSLPELVDRNDANVYRDILYLISSCKISHDVDGLAEIVPARPDRGWEMFNPLQVAIYRHNLNMTRFLLDMGADANVRLLQHPHAHRHQLWRGNDLIQFAAEQRRSIMLWWDGAGPKLDEMDAIICTLVRHHADPNKIQNLVYLQNATLVHCLYDHELVRRTLHQIYDDRNTWWHHSVLRAHLERGVRADDPVFWKSLLENPMYDDVYKIKMVDLLREFSLVQAPLQIVEILHNAIDANNEAVLFHVIQNWYVPRNLFADDATFPHPFERARMHKRWELALKLLQTFPTPQCPQHMDAVLAGYDAFAPGHWLFEYRNDLKARVCNI